MSVGEKESRGKSSAAQPLAEWTPPKVSVGDMVGWTFEGKGGTPTVGVVTAVNGRSVNVSLFVDGAAYLAPKRGARHITDPSLAEAVQVPGGVWDFLK